jgi:hypothetical protein
MGCRISGLEFRGVANEAGANGRVVQEVGDARQGERRAEAKRGFQSSSVRFLAFRRCRKTRDESGAHETLP